MNLLNGILTPASLRRLCAIPLFLLTATLGTGPVTFAQTTMPSFPFTLVGHGKGLSQVLDQIQIAYNIPINFEEAPLQYDGDVQIVNVAGLQPKRVSRASDLTVVLTSLDSTAYLAAQSAISAYIQAGYPGTYGVFQRTDRLDVLPVSVKDASGTTVNVGSLMSTSITFPTARRTVADTVETIANYVSQATGRNVLLISAPALAMRTVELGADSQSLGDVIQNFASALGDTFSLRLHYSVTDGAYYMDFRRTTPVDAAGKPWVPMPLIQPSKVGPANSPFFTKDK